MKGITRCSARHKDSPKGILLPLCKAQPQPSIRTHGLEPGREIHVPHPTAKDVTPGAANQPHGDTGRHMFHGSARGAEHRAPWDTLLHPQLPLPSETRTGSYTHPCERGQRRRGKQHGRQPRVCHPARSAAAPREQGTLQAQLSLCLPALQRGALPTLRKALQS